MGTHEIAGAVTAALRGAGFDVDGIEAKVVGTAPDQHVRVTVKLPEEQHNWARQVAAAAAETALTPADPRTVMIDFETTDDDE